jgi:hypothetical protein
MRRLAGHAQWHEVLRAVAASAMSIAPWWCGTIIAVKSWSTSPVGFTAMAVIILSMAALASFKYGAS